MKKSRFTEEQITYALRQAESGVASSLRLLRRGIAAAPATIG